MTDLLTPEQIDGIKKRDADDRLAGISLPVPMPQSMIDRHLLLRDREAIVEKIASIALGLESSYDACKAEIAAEELRALVTAIRGNQGDSK